MLVCWWNFSQIDQESGKDSNLWLKVTNSGHFCVHWMISSALCWPIIGGKSVCSCEGDKKRKWPVLWSISERMYTVAKDGFTHQAKISSERAELVDCESREVRSFLSLITSSAYYGQYRKFPLQFRRAKASIKSPIHGRVCRMHTI